ncbi:MAG: cell cycle transcriptional regulator TrcR [Parvularculaceae bacterium]|nr:cell cycle transcriptional regulator TrcR [Parvularculaceae bacterium]
MSDKPLMPLATAVWLIENSSLSFDQIADFCVLHPLQVKGIADGDVAVGVRGISPITNNQLVREELDKAQADENYRMKLARTKTIVAEAPRKGPRYTPVSKRQNRPDAILWVVRNHPEITDAQIAKLLGTTKSTIQSVRDRSHWNSQNITPQDPVGLGLCSQTDLDMLVRKAAAKRAKLAPAADDSATLKPAAETIARIDEPREEREKPLDLSKVFANLGGSAKPEKTWEEDEDEDEFGRKKKRR